MNRNKFVTIDARAPSSRLLVDRVKIFSDGSLGAETAALRLPQDSAAPSEQTHKGVLMHKREAMRSMIAEARSNGYRLEVHAIGDAAAEQVTILLLLWLSLNIIYVLC